MAIVGFAIGKNLAVTMRLSAQYRPGVLVVMEYLN
jgi:hypothetical protein